LALAGGVPVWLIATFVVLLGLAFGSFLNVCISRLPRHESIVQPGSRCPKCRNAIRAWDNVPVLSWMLLSGRCRVCRWRIPWRYPAVEVATAALFLLCFLRYGLTISSGGLAVFCFLMLGLAVMDAETMLLPDAFTWPGIALGIAWSGLVLARGPIPGTPLLLPSRKPGIGIRYHLAGSSTFWQLMISGMINAAICALVAALVILAIRWIYRLARGKEGMGLGDAKLLAMIGAWLGADLTLEVLFLGVLSAALVGLVGMVRRRRSLEMRLPFGSFLCASAIFVAFAGQPIIEWYLKFFP
jgi:leader peptidase (prepilin peptidase)/N-methyltransferase